MLQLITELKNITPFSHLCFHHANDLYVEIVEELLILKVQLIPTSRQKCALTLWQILVTFDPSPFYLLCHHGNDV